MIFQTKLIRASPAADVAKEYFDMYNSIRQFIAEREKEFDLIPENRKSILENISSYILNQLEKNEPANLVYICTHNSRRSQFGQIAGVLAADYYQLKNIHSFSAGTEVTCFNKNAIDSLKNIGFKITTNQESSNPVFHVFYGEDLFTPCFSKLINDPVNPNENFAAIMTCSDADEKCPFIPNAAARISTTYEDPKIFDGLQNVDLVYTERFSQILRETLFAFSKIAK